MFEFKVKAEFGDINRRLAQLERGLRDQVLARALNRTGDAVRTQAKKSISTTYNITSTKTNERLRVDKTHRQGNLVVVVRVVSKHGRRATNLITFGAKPIAKRGGVQVKIRRDRPPMRGGKWFIITNNRTGGRFVARRTGPHRTKDIKSVTTVDVPSMFNSRAVNAAMVGRARAVFRAEFDRQLALVSRMR
jgi:hypothetical protein